MKVAELISHLKKFDPELEVWTAIDDEGNGFNSLHYEPEERFVPKDDTYRSDEAWEWNDLLEDKTSSIFGDKITESEAAKDIFEEYRKVVLL